MSELGELEKRIAEALTRIRAGVEGMSATPTEDVVSAAEADALAEQLSLVTADLAEATDALAAERAKIGGQASQIEALSTQVTGLKADLARASSQTDDLDAAQAELRTLRASVQELQTANAELRRSALSGVTSPDLINRSLAADLEAVQAARLSELRDLDAVLRVLSPVLEEASNA